MSPFGVHFYSYKHKNNQTLRRRILIIFIFRSYAFWADWTFLECTRIGRTDKVEEFVNQMNRD